VREAFESGELNQYIFIFTVATIFYLPLGFVTVKLSSIYVDSKLTSQSVFGMHLYDTTDPGVVHARPKFWITIVVISVATYVIVGYWLVRNENKDFLKDWLKSKANAG
jgi:hypothetical protein